ncbi:MAG: flippase-like domain-containing protein [Acidobacteria bacterium]|nr:flippase-like domain-containing protein [Acidobacteriota bacterium]
MRKYIKFIVLVLITIAIFWFFGRNLDWQEISTALRRANPYYLGLAFLGICLGYFLRAVRWQVLLSPIADAKIRDLFATTTVGFTAILFVGRAGEIVRPMWLPMRDNRIRPSAALVTIFVERVFDLASLMAFFSISLMFFRTPEGRETEFASIKLAGNIIVAIIVAGIIGMIIYHRYSAQIIDWAAAFTDRGFVPKRVRYVFLSLMRNMATALDILKSPREIILATFWTVALWVAIAIPTWIVLMAFDLPMTFLDSTFVMGVASLGTLIPTPGGAAGAFHAATAGSLIILGVEREQAAAVSIIMHLIYFAPALVFGLYYLFHGDISIEKFRSLLSSENAEKEIESDSPDFEKVESEK